MTASRDDPGFFRGAGPLVALALIVIAVAIIALIRAAYSAEIPDPRLTPGAYRTGTVAEICGTRWGHDRRHVTLAMKKRVAAAYGIPWSDAKLYEFDHLFPRELLGLDVPENIWPQQWAAPWGAHQKDRLENRAHSEICAGRITQAEAIALFAPDWRVGYRRFFPDPKRSALTGTRRHERGSNTRRPARRATENGRDKAGPRRSR